MLQNVEYIEGSQLGGGVSTFPNFFSLIPNQSPNSMNVKFGIGGTVEKRLGTSTTNAVALAGTAGWGIFDFGATSIRWLMVAAGTGVFASSNRGVSFVTVSTGSQTQNYQFAERSKSFLVWTSQAQDPVLFWAGSVGTFMQALAPGSAPACKYARDYQGFLFLMNSPARPRGMFYAPNASFTTDAWASSFDLPSTNDDEITGSIILYRKLYVFTRYKVFRVSFIGGNPDFGFQDIKDWGAIPETMRKVSVPNVGEVIICLAWDKTLRLFDGTEDQIISDGLFRNNQMSPVYFDNININAIDRSRAETDINEQVYKLLIPIGTSAQNTHMVCFNYRIAPLYPYSYIGFGGLSYRVGAMYPYDNMGYMGLTMAVSGNSKLLFAVDSSGFVHIMDSGNLDKGTQAVAEYYDSSFLVARSPQAAAKSQQLSLFFTPTSSGTLFYQDRTDFSNAFGTARDTISFANTAGLVQVKKTIDIPFTQNVYQFRITGSGTTVNAANPWRLNRADFGITSLGYGKA